MDVHHVYRRIRTERTSEHSNKGAEFLRRIPDRIRKQILKRWVAGDSYRKIRRDLRVGLATINQIKEEAKTEKPDLEDLRKLSLLLKRSHIDFYDALRASSLLDKLNKCGVSLDDMDNFIKLVDTVVSGKNRGKEEIVEAAIKIMDLEEKAGKPYTELVKDFQKKSSKILNLKVEISRLEQERDLSRVEKSKLEERTRVLRNEIEELDDQKNRLLDDTTSLRSVIHVLRDGIVYIPCKNCHSSLSLQLPTKKKYKTLIKSGLAYNVTCHHCGHSNQIPPIEVLAQIGWKLLPTDDDLVIIDP